MGTLKDSTVPAVEREAQCKEEGLWQSERELQGGEGQGRGDSEHIGK